MTDRIIDSYQAFGEAERLAVTHAPKSSRARFRALFMLDAQLGRIVHATRESALAQLKLAWWRDACGDLPETSDTPLVRELALAWGADRAVLAGLVDGWEELAVGDGTCQDRAERLAVARARAFAAAAGVSLDEYCSIAAMRWTLAGLAFHAEDDGLRAEYIQAARMLPPVRLSPDLRPLALLDGLARRAIKRGGRALIGDRLSPLVALRLGIFGR